MTKAKTETKTKPKAEATSAKYINIRKGAVFTTKGKIFANDFVELPTEEGDVNPGLKKV